MVRENLSELAAWIIHKMVRQGRWGHRVIREGNIPNKKASKGSVREALKELQEVDLIIKKHGLRENIYSLNSHKKNEIMEIDSSFLRV